MVRDALRLSEEPSISQISPPLVKIIFLVIGALRRLAVEGPPSAIGPSVGQRGPSVGKKPSVGQNVFSWSKGPPLFNTKRLSISHRTICWSEEGPPSVKNYFLGQRGPPLLHNDRGVHGLQRGPFALDHGPHTHLAQGGPGWGLGPDWGP